MASWTQHPPGTRSGSTATSAPRCCRRSRRWCRSGTAPTPCSPASWTCRRCTASWPRSRRSVWTCSRSTSSPQTANHQDQVIAAHLDGHYLQAHSARLREGAAPVTSAPVRDPLSDHLITPKNAALLLIDYQPAQMAGSAPTTNKVVNLMSDATSTDSARDRRWLVLGVIGLAQLMVVLDLTVMNIALPSAQRALHFTTVDRQWVVTAYTLAFGSLLLLGGRLVDLLGRKVTFLTGLAGFAGVSAIGGASVSFAMLVTARACQGAFGALLVSGGLFCLVYGFSNAATHSWQAPSTCGFLAAGVVLLVVFALWQGRAAHPLLPPRVVLDRNRGGAYLSMLIGTAGLFGTFLFLTYYLQQTLGYSPLVTGFAFLPMSGGLIVMANLSTIALMPRFGPKPLVASGMLAAAGGTAWLAQLGPRTGYTTGVLGPLILAGVGLGMVIAPAINTGTFGVAPQDAGVAAATVTVGQMLGGSVGTSLLNTIFASAVASYLTAHLALARLIGRQALTGLALAHGYETAFWWIAGIFAGGAVIGGTLLRPGPLVQQRTPSPADDRVITAQTKASPTHPA